MHKKTVKCAAIITMVTCLVLIFAAVFETQYARLMSPFYRAVIVTIAPDYDVKEFILDVKGPTPRFVLELRNNVPRYIQGQYLPEGGVYKSTTLVSHAVLHTVLMIIILLSSLLITGKKPVMMLFMFMPMLMLVEYADIPFVLTGSIEDIILYSVDPALTRSSSLVNWMHFLNGGGRIGLSVSAALVILFYTFSGHRKAATE